MLIVSHKKLIKSASEISSLRKMKRTLIVFDVEHAIRYNAELFLINQADEVGGEDTSIFVGRSRAMRSRSQYFYRGKFLSPNIYKDPIKKILDGNTMVQLDAVSYSYTMNGTTKFNGIEEMASTDFMDQMTGEIPEYPSTEPFHIPSPKYYTESHQHFAGEERQDFMEKIMGRLNKSDYFTRLADLVDENTTILHCTVNASGWNDADGLPDGDLSKFDTVYGVGSLHYLMNFISYVQHCVLINMIDILTLVVDTQEGYNITRYRSALKPYGADIKKTDAFMLLIQTIENEYQNLLDTYNKKAVRFYIDYNQGIVNVKITSRDAPLVNNTRSRSQSDIMFYDFFTYLK